jgi:hypothetical protein
MNDEYEDIRVEKEGPMEQNPGEKIKLVIPII